MLENDRDEINYHKFLKSVRKSQDVSMDNVALGVCTKSGMSRIENGTRLPDKLVRDRLTARLGISGEEYEEYLLPREYEQWERRMEIIRCINKKDIPGAEEKIDVYGSTYDSNQVDIQFVEAMKFMVLEMNEATEEELFAQVSKALACTVPDMDAALDGAHLLADQELNLIMEYVRLRKEVVPERNLTEWKLKEYDKVVTYVEKSRLDRIARAKVYSKLACFISELILTDYVNDDSLCYALDICSRAIEALRDTVRLYYFVELNEYRMELIEKLYERTTEEGCTNFESLYQTSKEWATLLSEMYTENELPIYMENFTYFYTETECNNVCDVIRIRRKMMGMSRVKFCKNICDEKTLYRIEKQEVNPSMAVVRDLLERAGLCAEYKRARVVTSDAEVLNALEDVYAKMNSGHYEESFQIYTQICNKIDMDIAVNEQEMKRIKSLILKQTGRLSTERQRESLIDSIECTLAFDNLMSEKEICLTRSELWSVSNLAMHANGKEVDVCKNYLERLCDEILIMKSMETAKLCTYELVMENCADYMGNEGNYELSRQISRKLLKESLRNKRTTFIIDSEYNELWTYQQIKNSHNESIDRVYVKKSLTRGLHLSKLTRLSNWKQFFQQKLQIYDECL